MAFRLTPGSPGLLLQGHDIRRTASPFESRFGKRMGDFPEPRVEVHGLESLRLS